MTAADDVTGLVAPRPRLDARTGIILNIFPSLVGMVIMPGPAVFEMVVFDRCIAVVVTLLGRVTRAKPPARIIGTMPPASVALTDTGEHGAGPLERVARIVPDVTETGCVTRSIVELGTP